MKVIDSLRQSIDRGVTKMKNSKLFKRKPKHEQKNTDPDITDIDLTIAKIKTEKRNLNEQIRKYRNESKMYLEKAKEERANGNKELAARYFKNHQGRNSKITQLQNAILNLDDQIENINNAQATSNLMDTLRASTTCMEDLKKSMGTVEELDDLNNRQKELEDFVNELDDTLVESVKEEEIEDLSNVEKELEDRIKQDELKELDAIKVPDSLPIVEENDNIVVEKKVAVAEEE